MSSLANKSGILHFLSVGDGKLGLLATVNGKEYLDYDVQNGTVYNYVIEALNGNGESVASLKNSITFNPSDPDDRDDGIPWYLIVLPIVAMIMLLLLLLQPRSNSNRNKKGRRRRATDRSSPLGWTPCAHQAGLHVSHERQVRPTVAADGPWAPGHHMKVLLHHSQGQ